MKKKGLILSVALLSVVGMIGCAPKTGDSGVSSESSESVTYTVSLTNKDALTAEWHVGDENRTLEISVDPKININQALADGTLTVVSSNTGVVSASGKVLTAVAAGTATVTVTYAGASDSVEITVLAKSTAKDKYETEHEGTEEDPFTNEDAIKVAEATGTTATTEKYYIKGEIVSFRGSDTPGNSYGNVSFYLKAAADNGTKFLVYRAYMGEAKANVTEDDVWVGATVTVYCNIVNYNSNTPETSSGGWITKVEGTKPVDPVTYEVTVAEVLEVCKALGANESSYDKYAVTGYIVAKDSYSFYMSDTKGAADIDKSVQFQVYSYSNVSTFDTAEAVVGAKVTVTGTVTYYKSSSSDAYAYETSKIDSITVVESGLVAATSLSIGGDVSVEVGDTKTLTATFAPENARAETITWATGDAAIATVEDGKVTGVAVGSTTVTATSANGLTATVNVTVKESEAGVTTLNWDAATYVTANSVSNGTKVSTITPDAVVTLAAEATDDNTGKMYTNTDGTISEWRFYISGTGTLKVSVATGYTLVSAKANIGKSNYASETEDVELTIADGVASYSNTSSNFQVRSIVVKYKAA